MKRAALFALVLAVGGLSGCSSASSSFSTAGAGPPPATSRLTVFAAASLTGAFMAAQAGHPEITFNFAGSNALVAQITQGAPADVFASADQANMHKLVAAGLVEAPVSFARNKLEIAVAPGNPKHITGLADLARGDVSVVLAADGVPAGDYTRQVLAAQHVTVSPKSLETDVKAAITKVTASEADATVVYATDVAAAGAKVAGVVIPDAMQPTISYPIAVVTATNHHAAAQAFVDSAVSGDVQKALEAAGFSPQR